MFHNGLVLNWDFDSEYFFAKFRLKNQENWHREAQDFLKECYTDCGISDLVFNIFSQISLTPSKVFTDVVDKLSWKEENAVVVDYESHHYLPYHGKLRKQYGYGPTEVWIEHCKHLGIRPWISIRMNDNHYRDEPTSFLRSSFFYEALEKGWLLGDKVYRSGYRNFDYAAKEVQEKFWNYLSEQLSRLDVYGVEFDFTREAKCVRYLHAQDPCAPINEWMEGAKARVQECEKLHGHPIRIHVRLPRDLELCRRIGFDCVHWAKEGWVDSVTPTGHWLASDTGMPIEEWTGALSPYGVEVWAGMELCLPHKLYITPETAKAHTVQYAAQGSCRTYLFNYYHPNLHYMKENGHWFDVPSLEEMRKLWNESGNISLSQRGLRRHLLTEESLGFGDIKPRWAPLPAEISPESPLWIQTGEIHPGDEVTVYLDVEEGDFPLLRLNGGSALAPFPAKGAFLFRNPTVDRTRVAQYRADGESFEPILQAVTTATPCKVFYLEIAVNAR